MKNIKTILSRRFTFMLIPHGSGHPKQINIPVSLIAIFFALWTGVTCWGSYLSAQHIDYWRTKLSNEVLRLKISYLLTQLDKNSGYLDQVKQMEAQLSTMLQYKNAAALIQEAPTEKPSGATGGPTLADVNEVTSIMNHASSDISWKRLIEKADFVRNESIGRLTTYDELSQWLNKKRKMYRATPLGWPAPGSLTSHFGKRIDPFSGETEFHFGIDISGPVGTPIIATADGRVRIAGWHSGYGNLVVIEHNFGYSTRYAHNSRILVKPGEVIKRGQTIALMGATGKASGPHSHYEIWRNTERVNPFTFVKDQMKKSG
jgi:Peptidase family M23